jgi:diguanylate cyclase (GGDEF)-like protein/PAS domain S-box-containing protein
VQTTGVAREYWVGRRALEMFPGLDPHWLDDFAKVAAARTPCHFERYIKPVSRWYSVYSYPAAPGQFAVLAQDISERKRSEEALRQSEFRLNLAQSAARIGIWDWDLARHQASVSPQYYKLFGLPQGTPHRYEDFLAMILPEDRERVEAKVKQASTVESYAFETEYRIRREFDGAVRWMVSKGQFFTRQGRPLRAMGVAYDITQRRETEDKLRLTARVFDTTLESVVITDANSILIDVNTSFSLITGYSREEALGKNPRFLKSGRHGQAFYETMWHAVAFRGHWSGEIWNRRKSGEIFPVWLTISALTDEDGRPTHYVGIASDISLLKQHEKQLEHIAHYDALTGIPNRVLLADRMKQAIAQAVRKNTLLGVCYLDLDGFKPINDTLGHEAGDRVLIEIAQRITATLRDGDTVARLGGDEFAVLLLELEGFEECQATVERLLEAIAEPLALADKMFIVTASIGVTLFPVDHQDPDTLLRHADQAMYIAKQSGRNRHHFYDAERDRRALALSESLAQTRRGLLDGEFELFYQPKVHMGSGKLVGAEALIRWRSPKQGLLGPAEFLPWLENSEMENILGEWVIATALAQMERWRQTAQPLPVSVNIAASHLQSEGFLARLREKIAEYPDLPPGSLQIEILETAALADIQRVAGIIETCAEIGVKFALDDFGTGYSSLAYLRRLPAETLKIDQSFVRDMLTDLGDHAIVQGIIALAKAFDRNIVAEGVETEEHCRVLLEMGCEIGQGYGIARPMPVVEFAQWRRHKALKGQV